MKEQSDKSKSTWNSRKYMMTVKDFFHVQSEVPKDKSRQLFKKKIPIGTFFGKMTELSRKWFLRPAVYTVRSKSPLKNRF